MIAESWRLDLRYVLRSLLSRSGASIGTVMIVAVGVGIASAIFGLADPFLIRPLPFSDEERLVVMRAAAPRGAAEPVPALADWQEQTVFFRDVAAVREHVRFHVSVNGSPRLVQAMEVTENLLVLLGVQPVASGLLSSPAESADIPVVLTDSGRTRLFGAEELVEGALLRTNDGRALRVEGTLPKGFVLPRTRLTSTIDAVVSFKAGKVIEVSPGVVRPLTMIARLQPGVTPETVATVLNGAGATSGITVSVVAMSEFLRGNLRPIAGGALLSALLLLLICSANLGNVSLMRSFYRRRETALRAALGASKADMIRLQLAEHGLLALCGTALGVCIAVLALAAAARVVPAEYAVLGPPVVSWRVIGFATLAGVVTITGSVLVALFTAVRGGSMTQLTGRDDSRSRWLRRVLVFAQSALATLMLVNAGLLLTSYRELITQDVGFDKEAIAALVMPSVRRGPDAWRQVEETIAQLERLPGVTQVGAGVGSLVDGRVTVSHVSAVGTIPQAVSVKYVTDNYFTALGEGLVAGTWQPNATGTGSTVVSERLAHELWPQREAVGQVIHIGGSSRQVVAVAKDVFDRRLDSLPWKSVFLPLDSQSLKTAADLSYVIKVVDPDTPTLGRIRSTIERLNPDAVVADVSTLSERLSGTVRARTFVTFVTNLFALAAVVICVSGLAAVVGFTVVRRTREIAVRVSLGLTPQRARRLLVQEAFLASTAGLVAGLMAGGWVSTLFTSFMYGVRPAEPMVLVAIALVMFLVTNAVAWTVAAKILHLEAWTALRTE